MKYILWLTIAAVALAEGCATRSRLVPTLAFVSLSADKDAPQAAGTTVRWTAEIRGGVGDLTYEFRYRLDAEELVGSVGTTPAWDWVPQVAGTYAVSVIVRDRLGYVVRSEWSPEYRVAPALVLNALTPNLESPQRAKATRVFWAADATGGVSERSYEFRLHDGKRETVEQDGPEAFWVWSPRRPGAYRVKTIVRDALGNTVESVWSRLFEITPAVTRRSPIAVFPFENLSGRTVDLEELRRSLVDALASRGLEVLSDEAMLEFMARHRVRYVGGVAAKLGTALESEMGTAAVLIASVEQSIATDPPKLALHARLVSTGETATILWADGLAEAGHAAPGLLDLNRVHDLDTMQQGALAAIADDVSALVAAEEQGGVDSHAARGTVSDRSGRRIRTVSFYRDPASVTAEAETLRIAVLPFENESTRPNAGRILVLHFVRALSSLPGIEVVEPGDVRGTLLQARLIFDEGPSLAQTDVVRALLEADLVITGSVTDYQDPRGEWGEPVVSFAAQGIESERRRVGWTTISHAGGDDGVFFFGLGRVYTAHELAAGMVREVVARAVARRGRRADERLVPRSRTR